jgi:hypothetical protein
VATASAPSSVLSCPTPGLVHIAIRLTRPSQYAKDLPHHNPVEAVALACPGLKRLNKTTAGLAIHIGTNIGTIPDYGERRRDGERISTAFLGSTINLVVSPHFAKKRRTRWLRTGAYLLARTCSPVGIRPWSPATFRSQRSPPRLDLPTALDPLFIGRGRCYVVGQPSSTSTEKVDVRPGAGRHRVYQARLVRALNMRGMTLAVSAASWASRVGSFPTHSRLPLDLETTARARAMHASRVHKFGMDA